MTRHEPSRLADAVYWATYLHDGQTRKGSTVPYITHPIAVMALVAEHGGSEDQQIAAVLHDVVEDTSATVDDIRVRFGDAVGDIVAFCTDTGDEPLPWWVRKQGFVDRLNNVDEADADALLVVAADKLHNVNAIALALLEDEAALEVFTGTPEQIGWYYSAVAQALGGRLDSPLVDQLVIQADLLRFMLSEPVA